MKSFIKSNKQLFATIALAILIITGIILFIPVIDNLIIKYIELFFHKTLRKPERWIDIIQNTSRIIIFFSLTGYWLRYTIKGQVISSNLTTTLTDLQTSYLNKKNIIFYSLLTLLLLTAWFNIITANYFYADDIFRNYGGNRSWIGFSRYISEFGSIIIHNSLKLNDIAPLTQFLSILISAMTIIILSIALTDSIKIKNLLALSIIFLSPFYAENISYRFDCPYMALSLFFASVPFLFKTDRKSFIFTSIMCLLLTCFSYQAAISLYILSVIYIFAKNLIDKKNTKENLYFVAIAAMTFVFTLIIFKLFFMNRMTNNADDYFSTKIQITALPENIINYIKMTFTLNGGLLLKTLFSLSCLTLIPLSYKATKKKLSFIITPSLVILAYIISFGPYLAFERPVFAARAFMGFGVFFALILLATVELSERISPKTRKLACFLTISTVYACTVFLFTYGNCLKNQKEYEQFRMTLILKDLSELKENDSIPNISFEGSLDLCSKSRIAIKNYPLMSILVPTKPSKSSIWNKELLESYNFTCTANHTERTTDYKLMKQCSYHSIYKDGNNFIVVLK